MTITTTSLTRAAGVSAAVAGLVFVGVQVNHPPMEVASVTSTEWAIRNTAKAVMAALALAGITGMYLHQVRQTRVLGLVGFLLFGLGFLAMGSIALTAACVLPALADVAPAYVDDVLAAAVGETPTGDIGLMQTAFAVSGIAYLGGGLLFGVALYRARVLARWAAATLAFGTAATAALSVLPEAYDRPFAVPTGVALIGLGTSLWRSSGRPSSQPAGASMDAVQPAVR